MKIFRQPRERVLTMFSRKKSPLDNTAFLIDTLSANANHYFLTSDGEKHTVGEYTLFSANREHRTGTASSIIVHRNLTALRVCYKKKNT